MEALVSVIIPVHNACQTIDRCLNSVVNQTYRNLQIICCDDCSSDSTLEKLQSWSKRDSRIEVLHNDVNMYVAFTRNRCIEVAKGKYIAQIDDDDYCDNTRIMRQVEFLESNPTIDFVGTAMHMFDENGVWGSTGEKKGYLVHKRDFLLHCPFHNPSMMYKSEVLKSVDGYRVSKETERGEDYDMHMRMYQKGYVGYVMPDLLTFYYNGKNSIPKAKYKYRINEAIIRHKNFVKLGLYPRGIIYVVKPLIIGLIPVKLWGYIKKTLNQ